MTRTHGLWKVEGAGNDFVLGAGKWADRCECAFAGKTEATKMVTQLGFTCFRVELLQMLQRRMFRVQLFDLVLGEVTDAGVFMDFAFTLLQLQSILHRTGQ